ncbi:MAG: ATP-binding cassette domain-containing protein [Myxococcales bacterium]|nr:ATP-binding cassette domain-containing protein [Myxococcales bacterium]
MSEPSNPAALQPAGAPDASGERPVLLDARGVCKWFEVGGRRIDVLKGVDLQVRQGDMIAVIGRSGSGKSTLLHLLGALDTPSAGSIAYHARPLADRSDDEVAAFRNQTIGFVFQFHHLLPELTALENVLMPALIARKRRSEVVGPAQKLLERVGLGHRLDHHPGELSGGEQQRVALARALVMQPEIVFADEPTGNLDGHTAEEMHTLMEELNRETGTSFVIVSHNRELADRMDRVLQMGEGQVMPAEAV